MEKRVLKEWEKNMSAMFANTPQLANLINNPVYYSNATWINELNNYALKTFGASSGEDFYRIVFKEGSPKNLMTITNGELSGLKTACTVYNGKITGVAGLKRVDIKADYNFLSSILIMGMFGSIQNRLGYISNVCEDIRYRQLIGDHAKLEQISEVILDCFESISEMDADMMRLNLRRVTDKTDECHELLIVMRQELARQSEAYRLPYETFDVTMIDHSDQNRQTDRYYPHFFIEQMMKHNVFAAYERFVAGKICQIVLSGIYSKSNIERSKQSVIRVKDTIHKVFEDRILAHRRGLSNIETQMRKSEQGEDTSGMNLWGWKQQFERQQQTIKNIETKLDALLESKLESFDFLSQLASHDKIDVYLINGAIVINGNEAQRLTDQE